MKITRKSHRGLVLMAMLAVVALAPLGTDAQEPVSAAQTEHQYNDDIHYDYFLDGHWILITDNVVIRESTYELGITEEYWRILKGAAEIKYADRDIPGLYHLKPMHS